ncbi:PilZ domain-containing protein [Aurantimonas coralicida]|uniref:PilZ domain-containing protein n=1 Tax=Aurantimonas coralicida TaxID=182270 RepID=UPI00238738B3|nr:PilZ domain-containing protein [Aurantimonas coralicida]MDE0924257.1 PilZ domain-containing protein [Aurantimonas coralicida]
MAALPEHEPDDSERRVAPRTRTLKRAKVIFNGGFSTFDCIVRNISATGALLTIDDAAHLPKEFQIRIGEERDERPARLVYRRAMFAGIRFLDVEPGPEAGDQRPLPPQTTARQPESQPAQAPAGGIRKITPEALPAALTRLFAWS